MGRVPSHRACPASPRMPAQPHTGEPSCARTHTHIYTHRALPPLRRPLPEPQPPMAAPTAAAAPLLPPRCLQEPTSSGHPTFKVLLKFRGFCTDLHSWVLDRQCRVSGCRIPRGWVGGVGGGKLPGQLHSGTHLCLVVCVDWEACLPSESRQRCGGLGPGRYPLPCTAPFACVAARVFTF